MKPYIFEKRNAIYIINLGVTVRQLDAATQFLCRCRPARRQDPLRRLQEAGPGSHQGSRHRLRPVLRQPALARRHADQSRRPSARASAASSTSRKSKRTPITRRWASRNSPRCAARARNSGATSRASATCRSCPDAIIIIDTTREAIAVAESVRLHIPTVAIVDTNADPSLVNYPIAGNDDAIRAIRILLQKLVTAIASGGGESARREEVEMAGVSA